MTHGWVVLVPLKQLALAKSRMDCATAGHRQDLARAMAETVVATASQVPGVCEVVLVTPEPWHLTDARVRVIAEPPGGGLNAALGSAAAAVAADRPDCGVAALPADTAAATVEELTACLAAAGRRPRAFVADDAGTGTVLLTAGPGVALRPRFGPGSSNAHALSGAIDITGELDVPLLRRDLDTAADLAAVDRHLRRLPTMAAALRDAGWTGQEFRAPARTTG